ncbi:hypothetical protein Leryth_003040 [Lithospermum erythrorhizon]|nr:hypothetical protein Leryth_003040 [Lithospermum erythrorhizon]
MFRNGQLIFLDSFAAAEVRVSLVSQGHGNKRFLLEGNNGNNSSLALAADRTYRMDPLDHFRYYNGGWNISNKHYFSSVAYTSAPLIITAAVWFVVIGLGLLLSCLYFCCCRHQRYGYSKPAYTCSLIFLILFTIVAVVGCILLYIGQGKLHDSTTDTLDYVVHQSDYTVSNLRNVTPYLNAAKQAEVEQIFLPQETQDKIDQLIRLIDSSAYKLETETKKNKDFIQSVIDSAVRHELTTVSVVMLILALLGFLLSIFGLRVLVYILTVIAWILVAGTFVVSGLFFILHNAAGDACLAMNQWVENPTSHTSLDDLLPCVDQTTAQQSLNQSKDVVFILVQSVNMIITSVANIDPPSFVPILYYNQSGPQVPILCNPFNQDKTDRNCESGEQDFSNAPQVWKNYVCQVSLENCITVGRLKPKLYDEMASIVNITYGLYHYSPFLTDLVGCHFVRDTCNEIHDNYCPELLKYSEWVFICLVVVSAAVAISLICWGVYARERRHRKYTESVDAARNQNP